MASKRVLKGSKPTKHAKMEKDGRNFELYLAPAPPSGDNESDKYLL